MNRKIKLRLFAVMACGFVMCDTALAQPVITNQPQNQTSIAGTTAMFTVGATGAQPLSYQWRSHANGTMFTNIPFGTEATLVLTNVQPTSRRFAVVVTDAGGLSATSSPLVALTVLVPPVITVQPTNNVVDAGGTASFVVTASGTAPLIYQWEFNGRALAGNSSFTLTLVNVQYTNAGRYSVMVMNVAGSVTSQMAVLTVAPALHGFSKITAQAGATISLSLTGSARALFRQYYDLYPIEASTNLAAWTPLTMLQRTNADPDILTYLDRDTANFDRRFYHTPSNHLVTFLPQPTGPHPVGTLSRLLTDPSRTNAIRRTNHQFMISFWYPAIAQAGMLPSPYIERPLAQSSYWYGQYTDRVPFFVSHSLTNATLAASPTRFPILLYSPGADLHRRDNTDKAEELASHGYIVVGLDHRETPLSVFPDGTLVTGEPVDQTTYQGSVAQIQGRLQDERFVLDELTRLDATDPMFGGRLDLDRIGAFGFSRGGAASAQLCYNDTRCRAGINMDGWFLVSNAVRMPLPTPFLILRSDTPDVVMPDGRPDDLRPTFDTMTTNGYYVIVAQSDHWNFDTYFFRNQTPTFRRVHQIWTTYILSFFNKHLLNQDDHLLDCPSPYPEVIECLRK